MIDIRRILCPVDFSEATPFALRPAVSLATEYGAEVVLLHVLDFPYPHFQRIGSTFDVDEYYEQMEAQARRRLAELVDAESRRFTNVRSEVRRGTPYREIAKLATDEGVDLVVLPTQARTGLARIVWGSSARRVVQLAPCPVLTTSPRQGEPKAFQPARVLYATDFSKYAGHALPYATSIADTYGAALALVHVFTVWDRDPVNPEWRFPPLPEEERQALEAGARRQLEVIAETVKTQVGDATEVESRIVEGFDPAAELLAVAEEMAADLVVMATHGLTGLKHLLMGSVTERVVGLSKCPVLSVKHPEHEFVVSD